MIPGISISNCVPTILFPLLLVIIVTMIKDALEDKKRYDSDKEENNNNTYLLYNNYNTNNDNICIEKCFHDTKCDENNYCTLKGV